MAMFRYLVLVLLYPIHTFALDNFKYCCDIKRCQLIEQECRAYDRLVNDQTCSEACLASSKNFCAPVSSLGERNYTCFEPFLNRTDDSPLNLVCNQQYRQGEPPAPDVFIRYDWCWENCAGWKLSPAREPSSWAAPLLQYILPAVIFSMTVPRRQKWEVHDWLFDFDVNKLSHWPHVILSLFTAGAIITCDTAVWVFTIFTGSGPMLVGGLHEAYIDYKIISHLSDWGKEKKVRPNTGLSSERPDGASGATSQNGYVSINENRDRVFLTPQEKIELLLTMVSGNLDRNYNRPHSILGAVVGIDTRPRRENGETWQDFEARKGDWNRRVEISAIQLKSMLSSQYSFGSIVGAPVLFYLGAFIYTLVDLSGSSKGDNDIAHALAFGMWWMVIVHVAIVSGCLLASNNPSTATAIAASSIEQQRQAETAEHKKETEAALKARISLWRRPVYRSYFMPVQIWNRGCMKTLWLERTQAWQKHQWFREQVSLRWTWLAIVLFSFLLVLIPAMFGFLVSYFTPAVCLSCRSLTFTVYTGCQLILIAATTGRDYYYHFTDLQMNGVMRNDIEHTTYSESNEDPSEQHPDGPNGLVSQDGIEMTPSGSIAADRSSRQSASPPDRIVTWSTPKAASNIWLEIQLIWGLLGRHNLQYHEPRRDETGTEPSRDEGASADRRNHHGRKLKQAALPYVKRGILLVAVLVTFAAGLIALISGVGGTIMQILGVYRNCACNVPASLWFSSQRGSFQFNIASDFEEARDKSTRFWVPTVIAATGFMAGVTYLGWWYQRYLRLKFTKAAEAIDS